MSNVGGQVIPANSYAYLKFPALDNNFMKIESEGVITFKKTGIYLIVLNPVIYGLGESDAVDFVWQKELDAGIFTRINGVQGNYSRGSIVLFKYISAGEQDIPIFFNRTGTDKIAAMCSFSALMLPLG